MSTIAGVVLCSETDESLPRSERIRLATHIASGRIELPGHALERVRWGVRVFDFVELWLDTGAFEYHERTDVAASDDIPEVFAVELVGASA